MAVTAKSFQLWRSRIAPQATVSDLCREAGIKRSTLAQQLVRGKVAVATVVAIARAYAVPPVKALGEFDGYRDIPQGVAAPTDAELISQVSDIDLLRLIVARSEGREGIGHDLRLEIAPLPHQHSVRAWFDAVDPGDLRQTLAARTGIAPQNLSAQLSAGRLTTGLAVEAARIARVSLTSGLIVTGLLTPSEGGWAEGSRARALSNLPDSALLMLARDRLDSLGKQVRRQEHDNNRDRAIWENLG